MEPLNRLQSFGAFLPLVLQGSFKNTQNFNKLRTQIKKKMGFVPQFDVVHLKWPLLVLQKKVSPLHLFANLKVKQTCIKECKSM